jgi:EAL domain-containing protein (putative c-di-GMP-specific phosphodiesterase class I)
MRGRVASCSVNLSGMSLGDEQILERVGAWARDSGMDPSILCFEVTETAAIRNLSQARWFVDRLRDMGCRMALDDFGTGLSSFAYLKGLPVDLIKIDGTFVRDMLNDPVDRAVVTAINDIAHEVGMRTVAEFVEDDATFDALRRIGVDFAQGYGIARPLPLDELIADHIGAVNAVGGYFEK